MEIRGGGGGGPGSAVDTWVVGTPGAPRRRQRDTEPAPYSILAIGDPPTLAAAMNIPGGAMDRRRARRRLDGGTNSPTVWTIARPCGNRKPRQYAQPVQMSTCSQGAPVSEIPGDLHYTEEHEVGAAHR